MFEEEFAKLAVEPPRRLDSLPGLRLKGSIPRVAVFLPLFFVAMFAIMPLSLMHSDPAMRLAMGPTELAQGRVIANTNASACRGDSSHHVTYSFSVPSGREYRGGTNLCEQSPYYSANAGEAIEVRYLNSDPTLNTVASERQPEPPPFLFFFFMPFFFLAIFGAMFWPPIRELLRARRLFRKGRLATGQVVFVKKRSMGFWPGMPFNSASEVYIAFSAPGEARREGVASCQNDWLVNQFAPGTDVHIAFSEDKAARIVLLEAYMR